MPSLRRGLLVLPLLLLAAACDGPAQYAAVQVNVLLFDDGTGELSLLVPGTDHDEDDVEEFARSFADALGLPEPEVVSETGPLVLTGIPTNSVELDVSNLLTTVAALFPESADSTFVSVCVPHRMGRIDARGMAGKHHGSCVTFFTGDSGSDARPSAVARFEHQWHPASTTLVLAIATFVLGAAAILASARIRSAKASIAATLVGAAAGFTCLVLGWRSFSSSVDNDPYFATGLSFDESMGAWFANVALVSFVMGCVLIVSSLIESRRQRRRARTSVG